MDNLDLYKYPWYYGRINRQEAEENLIDRGEDEGCFLVRESSRAGQWSISVLDWIEGGCNVGHYLISQSADGLFYFEDDVTFKSIVELIQHYKDHSENVNFVLRCPCPRQVRIPDKDVNDYALYEVATELPAADEFLREKFLCSGCHSEIWQGHLKSCNTSRVVAKIAKNDSDSLHMLNHEANILKCLNHENIVLLRGVISKPEFHSVYHYAGDTNLIGFLLKNSGSSISLMDQLNIATQVVAALEFCARMKCVHRNVKAKSVIISSRDLKCKLAAFKNSRTVDQHGYYHAVTEEDNLALQNNSQIRWMAIEAAQHGRFSQVSDVWSFAVLLVEIFSGGGLPYAGHLTCKVLQEVENGFRCPKPHSCPKAVYSIMERCWAQSEGDRPDFKAVRQALKTYVDDNRETLVKLSPARSSETGRYAPWKHGSVKQQRTSSVRELTPVRRPTSPLPPLPVVVSQYGYDN